MMCLLWLRCSTGYYRLNGQCEVCPTAPWLIFVVVVLAAMVVLYVGYLLAKKQVRGFAWKCLCWLPFVG